LTIRITYGGTGSPLVAKTIDFPEYVYRMTPPEYVRQTLVNKSASGVVETLTVRTDVLIELGFRSFPNSTSAYATLKRNLKQWLLWAQAGETWTIALDSTDTVLTTLAGNPVEGDVTFALASTTGIVAGRSYVIRNDVDVEIVKVLSVASPNITIVEPLNVGFFLGDRFRTEMYWPARLSDNRPVIIEKPPLWYDVELRFEEDVNGL
jgi:hypothetical protein